MKPISHTEPNKALRGTLIFFLLTFMVISPDVLSAGNQENNLLSVIQVQNERYMDAYLTNDAVTLTELYTANATVIAPHFGPAKGHKEIQTSLADELAMGDGRLELQALEVTRVADDTAYEIGRYKFKVDLSGGGMSEDEGHTVVIWKLGKDNIWRIHVDIWNSSLPLP